MFVKIVRDAHVGIYEGTSVLLSYPTENEKEYLHIFIEPSHIDVKVEIIHKGVKPAKVIEGSKADNNTTVYLMNDEGQTVERIL